MAEISAQAVKELREITDLPMMRCKKALQEAGGDQKQAIEILKRDVGKVREKRAENATLEGRMFTLVRDDGSEAAMVEVQCESAPVAGGQNFGQFGTLLVKQLLEGPGAKTPEELLAQPAPDKSDRTLGEIWDDLVNKIREKIVVAPVDVAALRAERERRQGHHMLGHLRTEAYANLRRPIYPGSLRGRDRLTIDGNNRAIDAGKRRWAKPPGRATT